MVFELLPMVLQVFCNISNAWLYSMIYLLLRLIIDRFLVIVLVQFLSVIEYIDLAFEEC